MKRTWKAVLAVVVAATLGLVAYAASSAADAVNGKCPIKGDDVAADKTSEVKIKFCSAACQMKFEKDPGSFISKIDKVPNTKCPVDAKAPKDFEGTLTVAFCCGNCKGTFDADPSKYISKVKPKKAGK
jgi:YHS domain-containing protein